MLGLSTTDLRRATGTEWCCFTARVQTPVLSCTPGVCVCVELGLAELALGWDLLSWRWAGHCWAPVHGFIQMLRNENTPLLTQPPPAQPILAPQQQPVRAAVSSTQQTPAIIAGLAAAAAAAPCLPGLPLSTHFKQTSNQHDSTRAQNQQTYPSPSSTTKQCKS